MRFRIPVLFAALTLALPISAPADTPAEADAYVSNVADAKATLRDLWLSHVFWVRNVVHAHFAGDESAAKTAEAQVVANAQAIAGAIEPYYGAAASDQLFELLASHWTAISAYLNATRDGTTAGQDAAYKTLVANAGEIAAFLGGANPNLPVETLNALLTAHGAHHVQQIQQFHAKQYVAEAQTWAAMKDHMYVIADALAGGIAKQFPEKFR